MNTDQNQSFNTKRLSAWGKERCFFKDLVNSLRGLRGDLLYAIVPRVARPMPPRDPPYPAHKNIPIKNETLEQCKEIFNKIEADRDYLDKKARATFGVVAFLAPLLMAAFIFLLTNSDGDGSARISALTIGAFAFLLLVLGFVSTVRALAVQGREILFLDTVIDPTIPAIRPYDKTWHAQGLLYCASMNEAFNAHIAQCVRSAHVLTALAVIFAAATTIPALIVLTTQKEKVSTTNISSPIEVKMIETASMNNSIDQIRDELRVMNTTASLSTQINSINARLEALDAKINAITVARSTTPDSRKENSARSRNNN